MTPRTKRLVIKVSILALVVNGFLIVMQYRQNGHLVTQDYLRLAASLGTTVVALGVVAFLFSRLDRRNKSERP